MFRTPSPGDSLSVALRKLLQGDGGEVRLCRSLPQREQEVWTSKIKYLKNLAFCVWEDYSFHMQLSYQGRPVSFFTLVLAFPQLLSNQRGGWQHRLDCGLGSPHSHLEARNHWWLWHFLLIWQEIFSFHKCRFWYAGHCLKTNMNFYSGALSWIAPNQFPCIHPSFDCNWGIILKYPPGFLISKGSERIVLLTIF